MACPVFEGASGGALMVHRGEGPELVGLASFTAGRHATDVAFAVPLCRRSALWRLVNACAKALGAGAQEPDPSSPAWTEARRAAAEVERLSDDDALAALMRMREPIAALRTPALRTPAPAAKL